VLTAELFALHFDLLSHRFCLVIAPHNPRNEYCAVVGVRSFHRIPAMILCLPYFLGWMVSALGSRQDPIFDVYRPVNSLQSGPNGMLDDSCM
jgi:hypothetical protein